MTDSAKPAGLGVRHIAFQAIVAATFIGSEPAQLVFADEQLVAVLVPAAVGWFLQCRFGRCEAEGLVFPTLDAASTWILARFA